MTVSVAVCEMFSVKEWCDLENMVRVRSRMDPTHVQLWDRSYDLLLVELFHVEYYRDLEMWVKRSLKVIENGTI